jgi:putative FmdB family regulatory protein
MPAYDYDCAACGRRFEVTHGVHADGPTTCPLCGKGPVRKAITAAAIHYRGSGWAKKERRATTASATSKASTDGSGRESGSGHESGASEGTASTAGTTPGKTADKTSDKTSDQSSGGGAPASSD